MPFELRWLPRDSCFHARHELNERAYNSDVVSRGIREFVDRDWAAARENKDAYWAARIARLGPAEAFRVADDLRRQARLQDPTWPDETSRAEDLDAHVRLRDLLHRADSARRR